MMFKLEQIGETHTDETTNFKVVLDKPYTVSSFIDTVLKNTSDWGYIGIKNQTQIASSSWTPSGRKLGLPQPLRLRKQCQGMLQRVLLECSTPDSSSEGC